MIGRSFTALISPLHSGEGHGVRGSSVEHLASARERPAPAPFSRAHPGIGFGRRVVLSQYQYRENRISHRPFRHPAAAACFTPKEWGEGPTKTAPTAHPVPLTPVSENNRAAALRAPGNR